MITVTPPELRRTPLDESQLSFARPARSGRVSRAATPPPRPSFRPNLSRSFAASQRQQCVLLDLDL